MKPKQIAGCLLALSFSNACQVPLAPSAEGQAEADSGTGQSAASAAPAPNAYAELITQEALSESGLFQVHRVGDKLIFEIPNELLGRDMLLVSRIARVPADLAGGFMVAGHKTGEQVLRWERQGQRVLLRKVSFRNVADEQSPIYQSVVNNNFFPILAALSIEAEGPGEADEQHAKHSVLIDMTEFFEMDVPAISGLTAQLREAHKVKSIDKQRSFINYAHAFPKNVEVRHTLTFEAAEPPSDGSSKTLSLEMHQSMILLPKEPMRPRFADPRVGWITITRTNYGLDRQKAAEEAFIARWRLEPKDEAAYARGELVEPVQPIVYYIDPATPTKWRSYVREGVESWQSAFESAGFKQAILAKDPPSKEQDPSWSGEDVRHSMVRWAASTTRNAMGPSVTDPRSGEIIESDIVWYHNHLRSYRNRLLLETGAANPLAQRLPIDDELMGAALRQVIAHEVGHALGFPHNMMASSAYPVESLRDPEFAARMGVSASVMDYARQNYVAQPGDGLQGSDFIRRIGPYDHYALEWGYRLIPEAESAEAEKPILDAWILAKAHDPIYRFGSANGIDPRTQTEDLGDDPLLASAYGLANLKRVAPRLVDWTATPGEGYAELEELYDELLGQYSRYMDHVLCMIGGSYEDRKASDQPGLVYQAVAAHRQRAALAFLAEHALASPAWLSDAEILRRIGHGGELQRLSGLQAGLLKRLLDPARLQRMLEQELLAPGQACAVTEFFDDLSKLIWRAAPDAYARSLQRAHVERLEWLMGSTGAPAMEFATSDMRALARQQLSELEALARLRLASSQDKLMAAHYADVAERIKRFFES